MIQPEGAAFKIRNLSSKNGTFVNGLPAAERVLEAGDQIKAGSSLFLFLYEEDARPESESVMLDHGGVAPATTVLLRKEDAIYLKPEKILDALPRGGEGSQEGNRAPSSPAGGRQLC